MPSEQVVPLLRELSSASLINEHTPGRYAFHDLLRTYALGLALNTDSDGQRRAATRRVLDHYLHTAHVAANLLDPGRDPITLGPYEAGVVPERLDSHRHALAWFTAEQAVLLAAVDYAAATGSDTHTWQLAWALDTYLDRQGRWHEHGAVQHAAIAAAERSADPLVQARAHRLLAFSRTQLGHFDEAYTHLRQALELSTRVGHTIGQAHAYRILGYVCERQGRPGDALDHARQALDRHQAAGHQHGQAAALNAVGWYHAVLGDHLRALTCCQQALALHQDLANTHGQAASWDSLGYAHHQLGHHAEAIACYQQALTLYRNLSDRHDEADILDHLGDTYHAAGATAAAHGAWQDALAILEQLDHPGADQVRTKLHDLDGAIPG
jgi:tetratricopeptide (TPR) repeat protein